MTMLSSYRVLDLTDGPGMLCGYMLAALGADVLAIEPPDGSPARRTLPLQGGEDLWWQAYARGKRSRALDLATPEGRQTLERLATEADVLVESLSAAETREFQLTYEALAVINPALIVVSISPFGRSGPKADWPATDLTVWAAGGAHVLAGDADRAPVRTSVPQSFLHAGADAACATLIALAARRTSGLGQHVDVSAQQSAAQAALSANLAAPNDAGVTVRREAGGLAGAFPIQLVWPCADGHVAITLLFGPAFTEPNRRLLRWVHEAGHCSAADVETDWGARIAEMAVADTSPEPYFELCREIEAFTRERTATELFEEGLARGIYIARIMNVAELLDEKQFVARDYWQETPVRDTRARLPGAFARFSGTALAPLGPAPALDDFDGWRQSRSLPPAGSGGDRARATTARDDRVPPASVATSVRSDGSTGDAAPASSLKLPLAGLKVLDFTWVIAGPTFTRILADYGATVIKVESASRVEPARASPPFKDGQPTLAHSAPFANFNAGKLGITVDPGNPSGRDVIVDLARWADVVTESFSPKAMKGWGLDYESLRSVNPALIMLSTCLMGQTGPRAQVPGYGNMAAAITGFYELTGWPDRSPAGPYLAYTDGVAPRFMLASLLAALSHRDRTGAGQHIDIAQAEAAIHMLAPAILDWELNGRLWTRRGNRDLALCPHGVFPTRGDDCWVAIACQSDTAWQALCRLAGLSDVAGLVTAAERRAREDELEARLTRWTADQDAPELEARLIEAGIAAHVVQNSAECAVDPQLRERGHFVTVPHTEAGDMVVEGSRFRLSRTPARVARAGPVLGEHNVTVLTDILGYGDERLANVLASLAME